MTESNSVELFNVELFLTEKLILKVEIPLFEGFVHPSDFPKSGGDPVYPTPPPSPTESAIYMDLGFGIMFQPQTAPPQIAKKNPTTDIKKHRNGPNCKIAKKLRHIL